MKRPVGSCRGSRSTTVGTDALQDDSDLIASIREGDLSGLALLFDRYADDIRRVLARLGTPSGDLDDLVQQTFIDAHRASARFRPGMAARPWLIGIAAMLVRRRRRSIIRRLSMLGAWATVRAADFSGSSPYDSAELNDEGVRARRALLALSAKKREVFTLVALEGLSCAEAATALGIPLPTVWTRLHYARAELRAALADGDPRT